MFEAEFLSVSIFITNCILGGLYVERFLKRKYRRKVAFSVWVMLYLFAQVIIFETANELFSSNAFIGVVLHILVLFFVQSLIFYRDTSKQLFVTFSLVAGIEIVKHIASVLSIAASDILKKISVFLLEQEVIDTLEKIDILRKTVTLIAVIICALFYAVILVVYLKIVRKKFIRKDYRLRAHENIFLILPSVAALCISITMKLMILSVENGMTVTIYAKVPATTFWIPLICFLLLGMIVSSVILFQKLVELNEEEKKRVILENQIQQMQKEIGEIQEIYADMRGLRHDMRSHLGNIVAFIRKTTYEDCKELENYIGKMEETLNKLDFSYKTGNPITDIIIHQKNQETMRKQILFKVDFAYPAKQQIDAYDIGIVLNNALENAIEACEKVEGTRGIYLHSFMRGNLFFLEIENDFCGVIHINEKTGLPDSNKQDKMTHGIGISNILKCARKYMGDIDIAVTELEGRKKFHLSVMMNGSISLPK